MSFNLSLVLVALVFLVTIVSTGLYRRAALKYAFLIDLPDKSRKFHFKPTPLVGGLGIASGMLAGIVGFFLLGDFLIKTDDESNISKASVFITNGLKENSYYISLNANIEKDNFVANTINGSESLPFEINIVDIENGIIEVVIENRIIDFFIRGNEIVNLNTMETFSFSKNLNQKILIIDYFWIGLLFASFTILALSLLDDLIRGGIKPKLRLLLQSIISIALIFYSGVSLNSLGFSILGFEANLGILSLPFTVFAVIGITNAFNMIDGINGLCSGMVVIAISVLAVMGFNSPATIILIIMLTSIIGFLVYNLGLFGRQRRVFLGDNGSTTLGFIVAWLCIYYSSPEVNYIEPVSALWIVAIPLIDCINVIIIRFISGKGLFLPDRSHIHHILYTKLLCIYTKPKAEIGTLIILMLIGFILSFIGITLENIVLMSTSLLIIILIGIIYHYYSRRILVKNNTQ